MAVIENWALFAFIALFAFGIGNFILKLLADKVATPLLFILLYVGSFSVAIIYYVSSGTPTTVSPIHLILALIVGVFFSVGVLTATKSLELGQASQAVPIFNLNTLITVLLAIAILGEKLNLRIASGIAFGVISVYLLAT